MKLFFYIVLFFSLNLFASNPQVYAALGDTIYNNAPKIEKLKDIEKFKIIKLDVEKYVSMVKLIKEYGFAVEKKDKRYNQKEYLQHLRKLSKKNDFFVKFAKNNFKLSIDNEDSKTFEKIINTGLIDTKRNKDKIMQYYFAHQNEVDPKGVIQAFLDQDAKLREKQMQSKKQSKSKKELEAERIRYIRENDKRKHEALQRKLLEEVNRKKLEIRQEQKKELFN